jgi:hypothetical protein
VPRATEFAGLSSCRAGGCVPAPSLRHSKGLLRATADLAAEYLASMAQPYLELPCGIFRGRFALGCYLLDATICSLVAGCTAAYAAWKSVPATLGQHAAACYSRLCKDDEQWW